MRLSAVKAIHGDFKPAETEVWIEFPLKQDAILEITKKLQIINKKSIFGQLIFTLEKSNINSALCVLIFGVKNTMKISIESMQALVYHNYLAGYVRN